MVDHLGRIVDGDQLLYIIARSRHEQKSLHWPGGRHRDEQPRPGACAGEDRHPFRRARVGDRYVMEMLKETGGTLGGETSGHLLCLDRTTTGDALISALQVLAIMKQTGRSLAELAAPMPKYPQVLENVRMSRKIDIAASPAIQEAVSHAERRLGENGRIVLRAFRYRTRHPGDGRRRR